MALQTPVITLASHVTETQKNLYNITFRMVCADDDQDMAGLDETYPLKYRPGDNVADAVDDIIEFFQEKIDSYESAVAIETHPSMATGMTMIENGLVI